MTDSLNNINFLIVEDDEVDILALKRILIEMDKDIAFTIAHDGERALQVLRENETEGAEKDRYIVLLDLNMPRMNGHEFLAELRKDPQLKDTIVFVLSTSTDPRDIDGSYEQHVAGYIPKDRLEVDNFRRLFETYIELNRFPDT